ncbi:unnamed protein product [Linum tenue]|uniref:Uncharacterized protein n=1 Tax=Linum tenue TaxID=586396 RepID=A0AAV0RV32_9ROSI|nr:unnamed protein product [Linum tenue]
MISSLPFLLLPSSSQQSLRPRPQPAQSPPLPRFDPTPCPTSHRRSFAPSSQTRSPTRRRRSPPDASTQLPAALTAVPAPASILA